MKQSVTWTIAGEAGFGIMSSGILLAKTCTRAGYYIFAENDYPSLIRGGHNVVTVRIASEPFMGLTQNLHVLAALNAETVDKHRKNLKEGTYILYDPKDREWKQDDFPVQVNCIPVPLKDMITELKADSIMRNTIMLGASVALFGIKFDYLFSVIRDQFSPKGDEIVAINEKIAKAGYDLVHDTHADKKDMHLEPGTCKEPLAVINGSEAVGLGAIRAGLKFAAIYPMTPINAIITFFAEHTKKLGIVYKQPEDEIAGINMAIGAAIQGVRSMVATSGGGYALMNEGVSLAGMAEVPVVIDMGMRVGPATGMPTYTEQGELLYVIHSGHGEFPRIVLTPGDAKEAYRLTVSAFQLADRYQTPVFILTDKYLNESQWCVPLSVFQKKVEIDRGKLLFQDTGKKDGDFLRYDPTVPDGISARSVPGTKNGLYYANSYEHDGKGHMTDTVTMRTAMADKRMRKMKTMEKDIIQPVYTGDADADILFVTWGTSKGPSISAAAILRAQGKKAAVLSYPWVYPFPKEKTVAYLHNAKQVVLIEQNSTGQLGKLIRMETGIEIPKKFLKYDGRPWYPEEIVEKLDH